MIFLGEMQMIHHQGFEFLPSPANVKMKVWGSTIQELFRNALRGMLFYLEPSFLSAANLKQKEKMYVSVEAVDINSLLVEFLSEVIARSDIENMVCTDISFETFGENFLTGKFSGASVDGCNNEIKAVSYYEVDIKKNPETGFFETVLVLDI